MLSLMKVQRSWPSELPRKPGPSGLGIKSPPYNVFTSLDRAVLLRSLENWVQAYELANYNAKHRNLVAFLN